MFCFKKRNVWLYIFAILKLQSYWTKFHHIYLQYSQVITY